MLSLKDIEKKRRFVTDNAVKCQCGHSLFFKRDYIICTWCGNMVFRNDKAKFKYKLNQAIKKKKVK